MKVSDNMDDDVEENGLRPHRRRPLEALYSEVKRIDQLSAAESRRMDGIIEAQKTAVTAALAAAEKAVVAALAASEKAVTKAEVAQQRVNEGQNEFRGTLKDQATMLMPRVETENLIRELRGLIAGQTIEIAGLRSRLDIGPPSLGVLQARSDQSIGRITGWGDARLVFLGVVAAAGFVLALISFLTP